ncbi:hypothetical protein K469DRAFT_738861 [Zopfia rhizophila CBS 207.26]|uniref:Uncharacterized protein n=1 Tax=Zopfia rhizophila CBS 207.26 TaxID=1314779 RepID=A0A6A6E5G2_9PEZI|nr:hypothetical protein K469DRAFT_738861 [Zopfia rhizophila CBS 207.26]
MQENPRQGTKLVKRRPVPFPTRERPPSALLGDTVRQRPPWGPPAVPPLNTNETSGTSSTMPSNNPTFLGKEKKSKWRLSNPFHSKDKERKEAHDLTGDSAYGSSEANNSQSDVNSSGVPGFSSTEGRNSQRTLRPLRTTIQAPKMNVTPPTPPTRNRNAPSTHMSNNPPNVKNISKETRHDPNTGNVVPTTTTTTATTTTTTGPGGSTTVQMPVRDSRGASPQANVTNTGPTNFSYAARTPPTGVPRHVPAQQPVGHPQQHQAQQSGGHLQQHQAHHNVGYREPANGGYPAPLRAGQRPQQPQPLHKPSTLSNFKTAAAGIHGAGEPLRGTLNSTDDKRFVAPTSTVHAKNQQAINRGREEIETGAQRGTVIKTHKDPEEG